MSRFIILTVSLLLSIGSSADEKKLLIPISEKKAEKIRSYNEPSFSQAVYSASRYRIVKVNNKLLSTDDEFILNPFDGIETEVTPIKTDKNSATNSSIFFGRTNKWKRLSESIKRRPDIEKEKISDENLLNILTGITFYSNSWDVDKETGEAIPRSQRSTGNMATNPVREPIKTSSLKKDDFNTVFGRFTLILESAKTEKQKTYILKPLKYTPKYHLIVEIDESKVAGTLDTPENQMTEKQKEKAKKRKKFRESLPKEIKGKKVKGEI